MTGRKSDYILPASLLNGFERIKAILNKDIYINGTGMRILGVHFMDFGPKWLVKRHRHSFYEFHYVIKGNVYSTVEEVEYKVEEGDFYLMSPGTFHSHVQKNGESHIGVAFRWEFLENSEKNTRDFTNFENTFDEFSHLKAKAKTIYPDPVRDDRKIFNAIVQLLEMASQKATPLQMQIQMIQLTGIILNSYPVQNITKTNADNPRIIGVPRSDMLASGCVQTQNPGKPVIIQQKTTAETSDSFDMAATRSHTDSENQIIYAAVQFLQDNYSEQIDVQDVANSIHFSYSYLARIFTRYMGQTITQYTNRLRINKAIRLLVCTNMKISQIAIETGFSNPNYFCMVFRKLEGRTPESVREERLCLPDDPCI